MFSPPRGRIIYLQTRNTLSLFSSPIAFGHLQDIKVCHSYIHVWLHSLKKWGCSPKTILPDQLPLSIQCLAQSLASLCNVSWTQLNIKTWNILTNFTISQVLKMQISPRTYTYWVVTCPEKPVLGSFPKLCSCFASHSVVPLAHISGSRWNVTKDKRENVGELKGS